MIRRGGPRWVFTDDRAHVLADDGGGGGGGDGAPAFRTVCGLGVPGMATVYTVAPSLDVRRGCVPLPGDGEPPPDPLGVPPPTFPGTPTMLTDG